MFSRAFVTVFFIGVAFGLTYGQEVEVHGRFDANTIKIGEAVPFSLTARYPSHETVLFPDSGFSFAPFEVQRKLYFQTRTEKGKSYDSVVYFLTTYEIDSVQKLQLPVFLVHPRDCTAVYSNFSTIVLKQLVGALPDSLSAEKLPLKVNTGYLNVQWLLNYPLILLFGGILLLALIVAWIVFGKRIRRYFALRRLTKNHAAFVLRFSQSVDQLKQQFSSSRAESVFVIWKKYMESLVSRPYTKYTSKEILQMEHDQQLGLALQAINKIIYAGVNSSTDEPFMHLRAYTEQQFVKRVAEVKHG